MPDQRSELSDVVAVQILTQGEYHVVLLRE
jgi:hypothetical protein